MKITAFNPYSNAPLEEYSLLSEKELDIQLEKAKHAFSTWRTIPLAQRCEKVAALAGLLRQEKDFLAKTATLEMGKLLVEARAEVEKCATLCEYYAKNAESLLTAKQLEAGQHEKSYIVYEALGIILGIMPWNFPYWQVFRCAIPSLLIGNVVLIKHALNVPACGIAIANLFQKADFPEGVFSNLILDNQTTEKLIADSRIVGVSLTGSDRAGRAVAAQAGKNLKKSVLELGGSDPFIVLDDANLPEVVAQAVSARFQNAGQSCIAAKRFILMPSIAEVFTAEFKNKIEQFKPGNPLLEETTLAPMARMDLRDHLSNQVDQTVQKGALLLTGGKKLNFPGAFYSASLITNIPSSSPAACEELFGPVASLFIVKDIEEAIRVANNTPYGLGASIWSADIKRALTLASRIESGMLFINSIVKSHPALPFGGTKHSGYGRELAEVGLHEFANCKTIVVKE